MFFNFLAVPQNGHTEEEKEDEPKEGSELPESEDKNVQLLEAQESVDEPPETITEEAAPNDNEKTDVGSGEEPGQPNAESEEEPSLVPREGDVPVESGDRHSGSDAQILSRKMEVPNDKVTGRLILNMYPVLSSNWCYVIGCFFMYSRDLN